MTRSEPFLLLIFQVMPHVIFILDGNMLYVYLTSGNRLESSIHRIGGNRFKSLDPLTKRSLPIAGEWGDLEWGEEQEPEMDITRVLPHDCISKIISFTSPRDASRSSFVSSVFKEAADSDATWEAFLPFDCKSIVAQSSSPNLDQLPAKQLYLHLSDNPVLVADGKMVRSKPNFSFCYSREIRARTAVLFKKFLFMGFDGVTTSRFCCCCVFF